MSLRDRPIVGWALPVLMLVISLFVIGSDTGVVATRLRGVLFDSYQRLQPRHYEDTITHTGYSVRVLDSDGASLARFGPWPWPHATLAKLSREVKAQGAALIVFAFPLDVADPLSPTRLLEAVPPGPTADVARATLSQLPSPDDALVAAMSELATVTGFVLGAQNASHAPSLKATIGFIGTKNPFDHVPIFTTGAIAPVENMALDRKSTRLNSSHSRASRMPSSA